MRGMRRLVADETHQVKTKMYYVKVHDAPGEVLVAACDPEILWL